MESITQFYLKYRQNTQENWGKVHKVNIPWTPAHSSRTSVDILPPYRGAEAQEPACGPNALTQVGQLAVQWAVEQQKNLNPQVHSCRPQHTKSFVVLSVDTGRVLVQLWLAWHSLTLYDGDFELKAIFLSQSPSSGIPCMHHHNQLLNFLGHTHTTLILLQK